MMNEKAISPCKIITAGSSYLDIDAYACCVAMKELLELEGQRAIAYSCAPYNYSVCKSLVEEGQIEKELPSDCNTEEIRYIIVDVSDPEYIKDTVPLDQVTRVYDHHVGFEEYWTTRIGENSHIEFIGAAATLIFREWKKSGLVDKMSRSTSLLLIGAILDNTLNLTSSNTTSEDRETLETLCKKENVGEEWRASYFSEVQEKVEADLKNALFKDLKTVGNNPILPPRVAQLCVWNAESIISRLAEIRQWFSEFSDGWFINLVDIKDRCSFFICDDSDYQKKIRDIFDVDFKFGVARASVSYLRKEIIKKTLEWQ